MQKTKLGVSICLMSALVFFVAWFGGYIPSLLLAGYILLFEENEWLKKNAVRAVALLVSFSVLLGLINLIPNVLSWISTIVSVFNGTFSYLKFSQILSVFTKLITLCENVLFLVLGLMAVKMRTINIPFVDKLVEKYF